VKLPPFFEPGFRVEIGSYTFTADEIVRFAVKYDPQPFHVDEEKARSSIFGGLCASGWHTAAMWMRKHRDHAKQALAEWVAAGNPPYEIGPSPGFDNLRWIRPVYAGDTITYFNETRSCRPTASRPGWYVFTGLQEGLNQNGEPAFSFESVAFMKFPAEAGGQQE
jgi:acyl dehydratase